jgi:hypothetical protein
MRTFNRDEVACLRLQALGLAGRAAPRFTTPVEVVSHHLGMQAQDFPASRWAIGSRLEGCREADVLAAYDAGHLVRSWPMRGTVHAVASPDLPWMLDLMGHRALSGVQRRWEYLGIDEAMLERARDVAVTLLQGGRQSTRGAFVEALTQAGLDLTGQRSYHTVWYLAQTGTLVQGPTVDGEHALVLLDEWIPKPRRLDRDETLAELGRRYLEARGPATVEDLIHWTRLTKTDCRRAFALNDTAVTTVETPDGPHHMLAEHLETLDPACPEAGAATLALPAFDEHLLGYRRRDAVLDPEHAHLVDPGRNGVFRWTIVSRGRVVATWKRTRLTHHVRAEVTPFVPFSGADRRAAEKALGGWGAFAGTEVKVRWEA